MTNAAENLLRAPWLGSLAPDALDQLFRRARSVRSFLPLGVENGTLQAVLELVRWGPTGFNSQPARFLFVRSAEAKARLLPGLSQSNRERGAAAPVNVIVAWDSRFHDHLPTQFPSYDARAYFEKRPEALEPAGRLSATLQAGYFILAARALGLDVAPMSGFDAALLDREFFADSSWCSLLFINLGYGDHSGLQPRLPRLQFDQMAQII